MTAASVDYVPSFARDLSSCARCCAPVASVEVNRRQLSAEEAADALGLDADRVWTLVVSGRLPAIPGSWPPKIRRDNLEAYALGSSRPHPVDGGPARREGPVAESATKDSRASIVVGGTLDVAAVAGQLRIAKQTVYKLIRDGHLGCVREGRRIRVRPQDVETYLDAARLKPGQLAHLDPNRGRRRAVGGKLGSPELAFPTAGTDCATRVGTSSSRRQLQDGSVPRRPLAGARLVSM